MSKQQTVKSQGTSRACKTNTWRRLPRPLAKAMAFAIAAWSTQAQGAGPAFNAAWINQQAGKQAAADAARIGTMTQWGATLTAKQIQQINEQTRLSIANLGQVAQAAAAAAEAQRKAREAALRASGGIPDGLGDGGLKVDTNVATAGWSGADAPTQTIDPATGRVLVGVRQISERAILNWETFNVGRNTSLQFDQQANWAVLNRVNDPQARPSQIQGQISGAGTVMVLNRNGVIFSGTSQTDTGNLVAAAARMGDAQFRDNGLYSTTTTNGFTPSFTDAAGRLIVERGAQLSTRAPMTATQGGGYVLLAGGEVTNSGTITTPRGQTQLAAGDAFILRRGYGSEGNQVSTTRGNEVAVQRVAGGAAGAVTNDGVILAERGDITLAGHTVRQDGVALSTTSVSQRGTIHLLNSASDTDGSVTLGKGSVTAVLIEDSTETAVDGQRDALLKESAEQDLIRRNGVAIPPAFDNLAMLADRRDQSRVEIVSGGNTVFENGSMTLVTGGQIAVAATGRSFVAEGAKLDVAGAAAVKVAMDANNLKINVQGNEQRDAAGNRDSAALNNNDVWVDVRDLVFVPAGTNGYATDRYYTRGGLLEVGGYLGTTGRTVAEWAAVGGAITLGGKEVITQKGSSINLAGGSLAYQDGMVRTSWVKAPDGRLYPLSTAPGDILYEGIYKGFEVDYARWGKTDRFYNVALAPAMRWQQGYVVGRDAGKLTVNSPTAVLEGDIQANVLQGDRQTNARVPGITDGYKVGGNTVAQAGQLTLTNLNGVQPRPYESEVLFGNVDSVTGGMQAGDALSADRIGRALFDAASINRIGLGGLSIDSASRVTVDAPITLARGGELRFMAPEINVNAAVTAQSGRITLTNIFTQSSTAQLALTPANGDPMITLGSGASLNTRGVWANLWQDPNSGIDLAYVRGGSVTLDTTGGMDLQRGSVIDTSSGGAVLTSGKTAGARGGDVTLQANRALGSTGTSGTSDMTIDATLVGYGATGGKLTVGNRQVVIGGTGEASAPGTLRIGEDLFRQGFSQYVLDGYNGLTVAPGAQISVEMPVYRFNANARDVASGAPPTDAMTVWMPPVYIDDPVRGLLTQRGSASLTLQSLQADVPVDRQRETGSITVSTGAVIAVDPGSRITLNTPGQMTLDGHLNAWGGEIALLGENTVQRLAQTTTHGRSIWIGENAVLDVAARAVTRQDASGRTYGLVPDGGSIIVGARATQDSGQAAAADSFIVVRSGAVLDASGAQADLDAVTGLTRNATSAAGAGKINVASNGGTIAFSSYDGVYLDGTLRAHAGGSGAAGGTLAVSLETPLYQRSLNPAAELLVPREIVLSQKQRDSGIPGPLQPGVAGPSLAFGKAYLGVDRIGAGGFDNLSLLSNGMLTFDGDVSLKLGQSLQLRQRVIGLSETSGADARINLQAPHVLLGGVTSVPAEQMLFPVVNGGVSTRATSAKFGVDAGWIDIRDGIVFGVNETLALSSTSQVVDRRGFDSVSLASRGDIRFQAGGANVVGASGGVNTSIVTPGDLTLTAAQIYPATGANARAMAGYTGPQSYAEGRTLTIGRNTWNTVDDPAMPFSLFGMLLLGAPHVEQGGVVRAPLGNLQLGTDGFSTGRTESVRLLPGSVTSISAAGLTMPYGGTTDGVNYSYNGAEVTLPSNPGGITLAGQSIATEQGSLLDLSGGGKVTGAAFVSGRGGSTDALMNALMQYDRDGGNFSLPSLAKNPVYAIVPGAQAGAAPAAPAGNTASRAMVGQQITIPAGVPGLPAGTYTLMPSYYALLPGAFRVELGGAAPLGSTGRVVSMPNGSYTTTGTGSVAGAGIYNAVPTQLTLTPGDTVRKYSQYNETSYSDFVVADAARQGTPRGALPVDAGTLTLGFAAKPGSGRALRIDGAIDFAAAGGGYGGTAAITANYNGNIEVVGDGAVAPTEGYVSLRANDLNALHAARLVVGGNMGIRVGTASGTGNDRSRVGWSANSGDIVLRSGARLAAPEVILTTDPTNRITVEAGAEINTLGMGAVPYDSRDGYVYAPGGSILAVSNGWLDFLPSGAGSSERRGSIDVGACAAAGCNGNAGLYSDGTITVATAADFNLRESARFGTRNLVLSVPAVHIGDTSGLSNVDTSGLKLTQNLLARLLNGDPEKRAPALESLVLAAGEVDFYGNANLSTIDPSTGKSTLGQLVLTTPVIKGLGDADDRATLSTGTLVWNGVAKSAPGAVANGAPGTGSGTLDILADTILFGYASKTQPATRYSVDRMALGFDTVNLTASDRITANHEGSLSVYRAQGEYETGKGYRYSGGNLVLNTPLVTGDAGSVNQLTAGGKVSIAAPAGAKAATVGAEALGAELRIKANSIDVASTVALPSGKLTLEAPGDVTLQDASRIDLAGRSKTFFDVTRYSWGGDLVIESARGNVQQAGGSVIDLSAQNNAAGSLSVTATDAAAGHVTLAGRIDGASSGRYDAGGSMVPFQAGRIDVRAQTLDDFSGLNRRLTDAGMTGVRNFTLKQGDLVIGDEVKANAVSISVDGGRLTVNGMVDGSGVNPGSIRLAARDGLTLASMAKLDAHGTELRVDSYGQAIDAPNRATVDLTVSGRDAMLTLAPGATIDLRAADNVARGTLSLNASRDAARGNDMRIDVQGTPVISGAKSIAVNAFWRYDDAPSGTPGSDGRPVQEITQAYLDRLHGDSQAFIDAASGNAGLNGRLRGLIDSYGRVLHRRPGVEIASSTPDGDLRIVGDLDLSGYRYGAGADRAVRGSGEPGALVIRTGGNLSVNGSINDGFAPPPLTGNKLDENGWVIDTGNVVGTNIAVRGTVVLAAGTQIDQTRGALTFDIQIPASMVSGGVTVPLRVTLNQDYAVSADWIAGGEVRLVSGKVYQKGDVVPAGTLGRGTVIGAGNVLPMSMEIQAMTWPKGTPLDALQSSVTLAASATLKTGDVIPVNTVFKVAGNLNDEPVTQPLVLTSPILLSAGATFRSTETLNFGITVGSASVRRGMVIPAQFISGASVGVPAGTTGWVTTAPIWNSTGVLLYPAGATVTAAVPAGSFYGAGTTLPPTSPTNPGTLTTRSSTVPANVSLSFYSATTVRLAADTRVEAGGIIPAGTTQVTSTAYLPTTRPVGTDGTQGSLWAVAPMLPAGSQSWDMRLVSGADITAADTRTLRSASGLNGAGNLTLSDSHYQLSSAARTAGPIFSVIRTGTGDLDMLAGGDVSMESLFGVYTAGTQSRTVGAVGTDPYNQPRGLSLNGSALGTTVLGANGAAYETLVGPGSIYQAYYPEHGGNLFVTTQGDLGGRVLGSAQAPLTGQTSKQGPSASVGNWLWRQGGADIPTSWWINFGTYARAAGSIAAELPYVVGFTGFGALGGGNVTLAAGGDAGMMGLPASLAVSDNSPFSSALVAVVGGTGRVAPDGSLTLTGGGDLNLRVGRGLNASFDAITLKNVQHDLQGAMTNLRGHMNVSAASVGNIDLAYTNDTGLRANPFVARTSTADGGPVLVPGDATVSITTRGDLVLGGAADAGRVRLWNSSPFAANGVHYGGGGQAWFSLWTDHTAMDLFAAGGNLTPSTQASETFGNRVLEGDYAATDGRFVYPGTLRAVAANGSLYYGGAILAANGRSQNSDLQYSLVLAPSARGQLEFLAGDSIYAGRYAVDISGADPRTLPTPVRPAYVGTGAPVSVGNVSPDGVTRTGTNPYPLFALGADTASGTLHTRDSEPARFYALDGDILDLRTGEILNFLPSLNRTTSTWLVGGKPVWMMAGRDILGAGTIPGSPTAAPAEVGSATSIGNLFVHSNPNDISVVSAGRDIVYSSFNVAGPGTLEITAGRNILQEDKGSLVSMGPVGGGRDRNAGAGIVVQAGVGANGPDYAAVAQRYLDPANAADSGLPLDSAENAGRAAKTYERELATWLTERYGFSGPTDDALQVFAALPARQQAVFLRQVYFSELRASGREYNDASSRRFNSYLRGRQAIATLFPGQDKDGKPVQYAGDFTMFGGSGVRTDFGGAIQMLMPGGQAVFGVEGVAPPATAGVVTQGSGDIQMYAKGSILLGQSRIMTTFGGGILGWSAQGDINAGRGSKTTLVYPPASRVYDAFGNVTLSPTAPSTGAGIATLNPIPEVAPGAVDLIAPLGTIDVGEAGVRSSGAVNFAALQVVNAANVQAQGSTTGLQVASAPNVGALTAASAAASSATQTAQDALRQQAGDARSKMPSIVSVQVQGFGGDAERQ